MPSEFRGREEVIADVSAVCPSCRAAVPLLRVHRDGFACLSCGVALRVENFYSAMSQALCLGSIPMLLAVTPVEWLIVVPLSAMATIALRCTARW